MKYILLFLLLAGMGNLYAQKRNEIPGDKNVHRGVLSNGMTYYVCKNASPAKSASFYLVTKAGALMEEDDQNGLAHFLEHMAFNGSKLFPGNTLISRMEKQGVKYGENLNAFTSFDETVYHIDNALIENESVIDTCLMVLSEWCDGLLLTDEDIEEERGVIIEEWRTRRSSDVRIGEQIRPILFNHSKYASHDIIGDPEIIKNFPPQRLRDFYEAWHRPDLQAIIAVGDFNPKEMEAKIIERFGALPAVKDKPAHFVVDIPEQSEVLYTTADDPEQKYVNIGISYRTRFTAGDKQSYQDYKELYITSLYNMMMADRITSVREQQVASLRLDINYSPLLAGYGSYSIIVIPRPGQEEEALREAFIVHEDVRMNGFTKEEFLRAKADLMLRQQAANSGAVSNGSYVQMCRENFVHGTSIPVQGFEYKMFQKAMKEIKLEDINVKAATWTRTPNVNIIIGGPTSQKANFPTKEKVFEIMNGGISGYTRPVVEQEVPKEIFNMKVEPGKVVSVEPIPDLAAEKWTLSNGATVIYKYCNYSKTIAFKASSDGGLSLYSPEELPSASMVEGIIRHGIGDYDFLTIGKYMNGRNAEIGMGLSELSEDIFGNASVKDFETLLQLVHLVFVQPRFDRNVFDVMKNQSMTGVQVESTNIHHALQNAVNGLINKNNHRYREVNEEFVRDMDFDTFKRIFTERFSDASDFVFYVVGNVASKNIVKLVERYIGSIPSTHKHEKFVVHRNELSTGKYALKAPMTQSRGNIILMYEKEGEFSHKASFCATIFAEVVTLRLMEAIREKEGGTYDVSMNPQITRLPEEKIRLMLQYQCDPERVDALHDLTLEVINNMIEKGIRKDDFSKIVLALQKSFIQCEKDNDYWLTCLEQYVQFGENVDSPEFTTAILKSMTTEDINKWAKEYFDGVKLMDISVRPK